MNLSPHFTLAEMTASDTAKKRGIANSPSASQIAALVALCENVLEPVRKQFGKPVRVTSGFRIWTPTSQHGKGEAADFEVIGVPNIEVARWIRDNLRFDQLILEAWNKDDPNAGWIHCSYRVDRARKSVLRTPTGGAPYFAGLPS
jgi:zinc D-Ala-D-Ala carboxypeptidase